MRRRMEEGRRRKRSQGREAERDRRGDVFIQGRHAATPTPPDPPTSTPSPPSPLPIAHPFFPYPPPLPTPSNHHHSPFTQPPKQPPAPSLYFPSKNKKKQKEKRHPKTTRPLPPKEEGTTPTLMKTQGGKRGSAVVCVDIEKGGATHSVRVSLRPKSTRGRACLLFHTPSSHRF